jgi:hypothetical protein
MQKRVYTGLAAVMLLAFGAANAPAGFVLTNPSALNVNANAGSLNGTFGNLSHSTYNAYASRQTFDFENVNVSGGTGVTSASGGTATSSADSITATFSTPTDVQPGNTTANGGTYAVVASSTTYSTSGTQAINSNKNQLVITFSQPVQAVAFTLPRLLNTTDVTIIGPSETYDYAPTIVQGGANNYAFAYLAADAGSVVNSLRITVGTAGTQPSGYGLDDFSFVQSAPEPGSVGIIGLACSAFLFGRRRSALRAAIPPSLDR